MRFEEWWLSGSKGPCSLVMAASEVGGPLSMEDNTDLLTLPEDLDCHLDLADISEDWVSLMMQDLGGLESLPLSRDFSFSQMPCFDLQPDGCSGDHEQEQGQEQGSAGSLDFSGHGMLSYGVAESLWDGMEASGSSAPSSSLGPDDGSGSHTGIRHCCGSLQTSVPPMARNSFNSCPSTSPPFSHVSSPPGETSSWPSPESSFMGTDAGSSFLVDADGGLDLLPDHHAAATSCHVYDSKGEAAIAAPSSLSSSGKGDIVFSFSRSLPQGSGSSSSSRECGRDDVVQDMLLDHDLGSDGSESDSPTSSIFNTSCSNSVHQHEEGTNSVGTSSQQSLLQENGVLNGLDEESRGVTSVSTAADGMGNRVFVKGTNFATLNECKTSTVVDICCAQNCENSSPIVASQFKYTTKENTSLKEDFGKEKLSKGTKRKGDDRWMPRQTGSTCSEGQQRELSDGDKKELAGEAGEDDDEKRQARLMRNRESAQQSRQRKKVYVDELEHKLRTMTATVAELNATISHLTAENVNLRRQISYMYQQPPSVNGRPPVMAPPLMSLAPYPGMYGMRPIIPGVHVPPVPIPRLKPNSSVSKPAKKSKVSGKDHTTEKRKKRKAAGAAILGLFCFMMVIAPYSFGLPKLESSHQGGWEDRSNVVRAGGRVLTSWGEEDEPKGVWLSLIMSRWFRYESASSRQKEQDCQLCCVPSGQRRDSTSTSSGHWVNKQVSHNDENKNSRSSLGVAYSRELMSSQPLQKMAMDESQHEPGPRHDRPYENNQTNRVDAPVVLLGGLLLANASEPFAASMSVPRGNQLVTVQGSLIIQAIMAGDDAAERDVDTRGKEIGKDSGDKVLAEVLGQHMVKRKERAEVARRGVGQQVRQRVSREALGERRHVTADKALVRADGGESNTIPANQGAAYGNNILPALNAGDNFSQFILDDFSGLGLRTGICTEIFRFDATPSASEVQVSNQSDSKSTEPSGHLPNGTSSNESRNRRSRRDPFAIPLPPSQTQASEMTHNQSISAEDGFKGREQKSSMVVSVFTALQETEDGSKGQGSFFVVVLVDGVKYVTYSCSLPSKLQPQVVSG